jgi:hypothetical protein
MEDRTKEMFWVVRSFDMIWKLAYINESYATDRYFRCTCSSRGLHVCPSLGASLDSFTTSCELEYRKSGRDMQLSDTNNVAGQQHNRASPFVFRRSVEVLPSQQSGRIGS